MSTNITGIVAKGVVVPRSPQESEMSTNTPNVLPARSDWAVASLVIGAVFTLAATPMLSLLLALDISHWATIHPKIVVAILGYVAGVAVVLLCLASTVFGVAGIVGNRQRGHSIALGLAGFLLSGLNAAVWFVILLAWHSQAIHRM